MDIKAIQACLVEHGLDGWLLADFHGRNEIALHMLQVKGMLTRRSFYFIPVRGEPVALVSAIERSKFAGLPGKLIEFSEYRWLEAELKALLSDSKRVAMEYSPQGRLPYVGLVDAGTIELVREFGVEVVSSADLVASFQARLSPEQIASHRVAVANLMETKDLAFRYIAQVLKEGKSISEYDVRRFILEKFEQSNMNTDSGPVCAADVHAGDPHYEPSAENCTAIRIGQLILIDMWAKTGGEQSVFADITWVGYSGTAVDIPQKQQDIFSVLVRARDRAVAFLGEQLNRRPVFGYEVDDVCRGVISDAGYGRYYTHRTGHSITSSVHGPGPNIDNLETEDRRQLQPGHLFSIEPGIYLPEFGLRTEIDVLISDNGCEVTTLPLQNGVVPLF